MDNTKRLLIDTHKSAILDDLDAKHILDYLISREALSGDDYDHIVGLPTRIEQTRHLLQTLQENGSNEAYEVFVDSLSKDYHWLWEKFQVSTNSLNGSVYNESFEDSLSKGDVPRLPMHYIPRLELEKKTAEQLTQLKRHSMLVLHGMPGSGKTCIAIGALRSDAKLILDSFGGLVFWLNLGDCKTEEQIVCHQTKLYKKTNLYYGFRDSTVLSSISMSSISSNLDNNSLTSVDQGWQEFRHSLKQVFSEGLLREALLIMDDVTDKKVLEAFDIGCKRMVTTRDSSLVTPFLPQILPIENHFTEDESKQLFASCLEQNVEQLPRQAKKLHDICKGAPLLIALLGAQLADKKERFAHDKSYWNFYIDKLIKKDYLNIIKLRSYSSDPVNPFKPIEICVQSLDPLHQKLYKKLAVLPDDVKVSSKVLSILWKMPEHDVDSVMKQLKSKCLVIEFYDEDRRNYSYEIHDLLMSYIRSCFTHEEIKSLHSEVLKNYMELSDSNSLEILPDDGYIGYYIGYHIYETMNLGGKWTLFNNLFLNLKFLGNKVRLTGPADLISDLDKYGDKICTNNVERTMLSEIRTFMSTHGNDLYRYVYTDIVQCILQHCSKGILYQKAHELASQRSKNNELYFEFPHEANTEEIKYTTIDVMEAVCSVCFLTNFVLVGTETGNIRVFDINTNKMVKSLVEGGSPVKHLTVCPVSPWLLASLTVDGAIKMWCLDLTDEVDHQAEHEDIDEEELKFCENCDNCLAIDSKYGDHLQCDWANHSELLLANTVNTLIIYNKSGVPLKVIDTWERDRRIACCTFSSDDKCIVMGSNMANTNFLNIFDVESNKNITLFGEDHPVVKVFSISNSNNRVLVLTKTEVIEHIWYTFAPAFISSSHNNNGTHTIMHSYTIKNGLEFVSGIVNNSGTLLFVSTNDCRIICINLKTNSHIFDMDNRRGNVISMNVSEYLNEEYSPCCDVLLTGADNIENLVKIWYLDTSYVATASHKLRKPRLTSKFDCCFQNGCGSSPVTPSGHHTPPIENIITHSPIRINSMVLRKDSEAARKLVKKTTSLDRHSLKPLNLKGINNLQAENYISPLLAIIDDSNNIQIFKGRRLLLDIEEGSNDIITNVQISPCNQYIVFGLMSGAVNKFIMRSKEVKPILNINSPIQYLQFVNQNILVAMGQNNCLMAYTFSNGETNMKMLLPGNSRLGSQELLNDMIGHKPKIDKRRSNERNRSGTQSSASDDSSSPNGERTFPAIETKPVGLSKTSPLVKCFWLNDVGMLTVECNGTVKLWDCMLNLMYILNARQQNVTFTCAAFGHDNFLALCDDCGAFQVYELRNKNNGQMSLEIIGKQNRLNNKIICCDIAQTCKVLAMGLNTGNIVLWHIQGKYQIALLQLHKSKVQACRFSPSSDMLAPSISVPQSPSSPHPFGASSFSFTSARQYSDESNTQAEVAPLVLVSLAGEVVWWNISHVIKMRQQNLRGVRGTRNVLTPIMSPIDSRGPNGYDETIKRLSINVDDIHFFGDRPLSIDKGWEEFWRGKRCKEGSKRKEILACIKLSGESATNMACNENFTCFVTVDRTGSVHIMNVLRHNSTHSSHSNL